ncbi:MAG: ECF transporter S component [Mycoplasma sp.]
MNLYVVFAIVGIIFLFIISFCLEFFVAYKSVALKNRYQFYLKNTFKTSKIAITGIFVAIAVMANYFVIPIVPPQTVLITFFSITIGFVGILYGPLLGTLTGLLEDVLHYLFNSTGFSYYPGFTFSACLHGFFAGLFVLIFRYIIGRRKTLVISMISMLVMQILMVFSILLIYSDFSISRSFENIDKKFNGSGLVFLILYFTIPNVVMIISFLMPIVKPKKFEHLNVYYMIILYVLFDQFLISMVFDNLWVHDLYGVPIEPLIALKSFLLPMYVVIKFTLTYFPIIAIYNLWPNDTFIGLLFNNNNSNKCVENSKIKEISKN